ncbi:MAG: NERD domain-containing protein, partial [Ruminococcaceae bacterium]|nr:NERD domain-containing protein [Oscillospiraceae bacterium]
MGLFDKIKGPVFYKQDSEAERQLEALLNLKETASEKIADIIDQAIRYVEAGIAGEKQVRFELENSHIPMYVIHDLYLEHEGLTSQIDYLLITRKRNFVIECKNLYGNIEINNSGDFIRTFGHGRNAKKEGIYSPITQNRRHLELIKKIRAEEKNALMQVLFEKNFFQIYRSVVV